MRDVSFALVLYGDLVLFIFLYAFVNRHRRLIGFHLGMNIAMAVGGIVALSTGILLIFQYPFHFTVITILATTIGMGAGALFGALFDYQTMLSGLINGLMVGMMAPMLGAILREQFFFMIVLEILICLIIMILIVAVRRS